MTSKDMNSVKTIGQMNLKRCIYEPRKQNTFVLRQLPKDKVRSHKTRWVFDRL